MLFFEIIADYTIIQQLVLKTRDLYREFSINMTKSPKKTEKEVISHDIDIYQEKPESSDIEILCGRAAKLAYLSAHDLNALFYDVTESLTEESSICSQPYSILETVGPLLQVRYQRITWSCSRKPWTRVVFFGLIR